MPKDKELVLYAIVTILGIESDPLSLRPDKATVALEIGSYWSVLEVELFCD